MNQRDTYYIKKKLQRNRIHTFIRERNDIDQKSVSFDYYFDWYILLILLRYNLQNKRKLL